MNINSQSCPLILPDKIKVEEELGDEGVNLSNCQKVGPTFSKAIVKYEPRSEDPEGGGSIDGERALMLREDSQLETSDFGKSHVSKFESGNVITDLVPKVNTKVEEKSGITYELVGSYSGHRLQLKQESMQVVKFESESEVVDRKNSYSTSRSGSGFGNNISPFSKLTQKPKNEANDQISRCFKRVSNIRHESKCIILKDCSVRLHDLFSSESRSLGKVHSNDGICHCIFCQGNYKLPTDKNQCLSPANGKDFQRSSNIDRKENLKPFKCKYCPRSFSLRCNMKRHSRIHTREKPLKCELCSEKFIFSKKVDHVKWHMKRVHGIEKPFICSHCPASFKIKAQLAAHESTHSDERPLECAQCGKKFKNKPGLQVHLVSHDPEKHFKCLLCPAKYKWSAGLKVHMRGHNFEKPFKCEKCPAMFKTKGELKHHNSRHSDARPFKCEQCSLTFKTRIVLRSHTAVVHNYTGARPFKCKLCPKTYRSSSHLNEHFQSSHAEVRYSCTVCSVAYKAKTSLIDHMLMHSNAESFDCAICGRKFASETRLRHHMVSHSDKKPFKCKQCSAKFRKRQHLEQHLLMHSSEKPFKCGKCSAAFKLEQNLKSHAISHSAERPFLCKQCPAKFKRRANLKSHLITHTDIKVHKCTLCPAQYKHAGGLKDHTARQHSSVEKLYECAHCSAKFLVKRYLKSHMVKHQPKQFKCKVCKALFKRKKSLSTHLCQHTDK